MTQTYHPCICQCSMLTEFRAAFLFHTLNHPTRSNQSIPIFSYLRAPFLWWSKLMSSGANLAHCQRVSAQRSRHAAGGRAGTGSYHRGYNSDSEGDQRERQVLDSLNQPTSFPPWMSSSRPSGSMQGPWGKPPTGSGSRSGSAEIVYKLKGSAKLQDVMSGLSDDHGEAWKKELTHFRSPEVHLQPSLLPSMSLLSCHVGQLLQCMGRDC